MKRLIINNPDKYNTIIVRSKTTPKIVSDNKHCFYFHSYNKEHLCIHPDYDIQNYNIDYVEVELDDNGYIQLWDNMTLLE